MLRAPAGLTFIYLLIYFIIIMARRWSSTSCYVHPQYRHSYSFHPPHLFIHYHHHIDSLRRPHRPPFIHYYRHVDSSRRPHRAERAGHSFHHHHPFIPSFIIIIMLILYAGPHSFIHDHHIKLYAGPIAPNAPAWDAPLRLAYTKRHLTLKASETAEVRTSVSSSIHSCIPYFIHRSDDSSRVHR